MIKWARFLDHLVLNPSCNRARLINFGG